MSSNCYKVKTVSGDFNFDTLEHAEINKYAWKKGYSPTAFAQLAVINVNESEKAKTKKLFMRMTCIEAHPKAVFRNFFDPVYKDSCLEFFFAFEKNGSYVNCEINATGTAHIAVGKGRSDRKRIDEIISPPPIKVIKSHDRWAVETQFLQSDLYRIFGADISLEHGTTFRGNFYKCGDETPQPHYGMWNKIESSIPDFHRPEFFGKLLIE